jgi:hypothetical protein
MRFTLGARLLLLDFQGSGKTQEHLRTHLQDDPSIREEVLDSWLGGSVPRILRFFLRIFRDILAKISDGPSARVYNST